VKIAVYGKTPESKAQLRKEIVGAGFAYDEKKPDAVISYGGDGTFLKSESAYPGIPKALFRYSSICKKCHNLPITHALELLKKRKYTITEHEKLEANGLTATNEIAVRNKLPTHAIRFTLTVNGKRIGKEFIGDGIIIATPFGSTAYFHSIARKTFTKGIGVAFNNTTVQHPPLFLPEKSKILLTITRGEAFAAADNNPKMLTLKAGNTIMIKISQKKARLISF